MKNSSTSIKEAANIITERDNNNSGVAFELSKLLGIEV
jgi:hydroxymethylpyrimidine pyrophosphatase-like HAD family hydrolase